MSQNFNIDDFKLELSQSEVLQRIEDLKSYLADIGKRMVKLYQAQTVHDTDALKIFIYAQMLKVFDKVVNVSCSTGYDVWYVSEGGKEYHEPCEEDKHYKSYAICAVVLSKDAVSTFIYFNLDGEVYAHEVGDASDEGRGACISTKRGNWVWDISAEGNTNKYRLCRRIVISANQDLEQTPTNPVENLFTAKCFTRNKLMHEGWKGFDTNAEAQYVYPSDAPLYAISEELNKPQPQIVSLIDHNSETIRLYHKNQDGSAQYERFIETSMEKFKHSSVSNKIELNLEASE